jgi:hypothetical protein
MGTLASTVIKILPTLEHTTQPVPLNVSFIVQIGHGTSAGNGAGNLIVTA